MWTQFHPHVYLQGFPRKSAQTNSVFPFTLRKKKCFSWMCFHSFIESKLAHGGFRISLQSGHKLTTSVQQSD